MRPSRPLRRDVPATAERVPRVLLTPEAMSDVGRGCVVRFDWDPDELILVSHDAGGDVGTLGSSDGHVRRTCSACVMIGSSVRHAPTPDVFVGGPSCTLPHTVCDRQMLSGQSRMFWNPLFRCFQEMYGSGVVELTPNALTSHVIKCFK